MRSHTLCFVVKEPKVSFLRCRRYFKHEGCVKTKTEVSREDAAAAKTVKLIRPKLAPIGRVCSNITSRPLRVVSDPLDDTL